MMDITGISYSSALRAQLPADRDKIVPRVDRAMRLALLTRGGVPTEFTSHNVRNGVLTLIVEGEFEASFVHDAACSPKYAACRMLPGGSMLFSRSITISHF